MSICQLVTARIVRPTQLFLYFLIFKPPSGSRLPRVNNNNNTDNERRNSGSDGAEESPSSDAQLTDENTADDETWNESFRESSDTSSGRGNVGLLRDPPNYYEAVQYLRQVRSVTVLIVSRPNGQCLHGGAKKTRSIRFLLIMQLFASV